MSARAVAVIRPAANIISRLAFLYILSGQGQLHAFRDKSDHGLCRDGSDAGSKNSSGVNPTESTQPYLLATPFSRRIRIATSIELQFMWLLIPLAWRIQ
jgi:hypothetical protein